MTNKQKCEQATNVPSYGAYAKAVEFLRKSEGHSCTDCYYSDCHTSERRSDAKEVVRAFRDRTAIVASRIASFDV